jgi:hypothetical protein
MGPTTEAKSDSICSGGVAEFVILNTSDVERDFSDQVSSGSDGDSSMSDDVFLSYHEARRSKENYPRKLKKGEFLMQAKHNEEEGGVDETYWRRRQRNNAAVKRSRDKARQRQKESQRRLAELTAENHRLQMKADVLLKELSLLRGLFPAVGQVKTKILLQDVDAYLAESQ